jgi:hypothetical protein
MVDIEVKRGHCNGMVFFDRQTNCKNSIGTVVVFLIIKHEYARPFMRTPLVNEPHTSFPGLDDDVLYVHEPSGFEASDLGLTSTSLPACHP